MTDIQIPSKNAPEHKVRAGPIQVAVWRNTNQEGKTYYSVTMEKHYKLDEIWKTTNSMNKNDLPKAILALQKAYEYVTLKKTTKEIMEEEMAEIVDSNAVVEEKIE